MKIRRALVFMSHITLAYTRIALTSTLKVAAFASLFFWVVAAGMLLADNTTTVDKIIYALRLIISVASANALILGVLASIGLTWNWIGLTIGFARQSDELDLEQLSAEIPHYLARFNKYGLSAITLLLGLLFQERLVSVIVWSIIVFLWSLFHHAIASRAWKHVISTYPLYAQHAKKKKNVPTTEKPKIENTETDDFGHYEDVQQQLMKR
jgi:hypothetical protein